ncbi:hypothetical protein [Faecalicoccus sp.]|nr:hypothetical protein [Faecalicoccus sp.]MDY5110507.1 hypothetical protein [Faecalicoccus sp.]
MPSKLNLKHDMAFKSVFAPIRKKARSHFVPCSVPFSNSRFLLSEL